MQSRRSSGVAQKPAATSGRNFRTFLLMQQFAAHEIGGRIKQARLEAGLTQDELADLASGFSKRSLQDYESGVTTPYKHLQELSRLLRRPTEWFLYGDAEVKPETVTVTEREATDLRAELAVLRQTLSRIEGLLGGDGRNGRQVP